MVRDPCRLSSKAYPAHPASGARQVQWETGYVSPSPVTGGDQAEGCKNSGFISR